MPGMHKNRLGGRIPTGNKQKRKPPAKRKNPRTKRSKTGREAARHGLTIAEADRIMRSHQKRWAKPKKSYSAMAKRFTDK